jgi:hypothetical protein
MESESTAERGRQSVPKYKFNFNYFIVYRHFPFRALILFCSLFTLHYTFLCSRMRNLIALMAITVEFPWSPTHLLSKKNVRVLANIYVRKMASEHICSQIS